MSNDQANAANDPGISAALSQALPLTATTTVKNRLFKSAMSEQMGNADLAPTRELIHLYRTWARGGTGLLVTGNVMIDRNALGEPKNVVLDEQSDLAPFRDWASAGSEDNTQLWIQLNHPGKQSPNFLSDEPVAPSAVSLGRGLEKSFNTPRALTEAEIQQLIKKFADSALAAKDAGFGGVQVHSAHGYLVSQFLSPHHNRRTDQWGGVLENRMRFLREIYKAIRAAVGDDYPIGVKLNSADFQKGGFSEDDSMQVIQVLQTDGIDLIEISGGNYESPEMMGAGKPKVKSSTLIREAYFLDYAEKAQRLLSIPLVVTGGFRSAEAMNDALESGAADMIGIARPLAVQPDLSHQLLNNNRHQIELKPLTTGIKLLDAASMLSLTWYEHQLAYIGKGRGPKPNLSAWWSVFKTFGALGSFLVQKRRA